MFEIGDYDYRPVLCLHCFIDVSLHHIEITTKCIGTLFYVCTLRLEYESIIVDPQFQIILSK
jgi:hypothetical protein